MTYIIIGTAAVKNPGFLHDACDAFPGHIIVGLDAKDGKVATDGWSKLTGHDVVDLAKKFEDYGVEAMIYTDIGRDGMLTGVNIEATRALAQALTMPVIASRRPEQPRRRAGALREVEPEGIIGVIAGRAHLRGQARLRSSAQAAAEAQAARARPDMALAKRIIPCLDVTAGRVVKGVNFVELRDAGDPVEIAARYDEQGADELTFLDITASTDERDMILHVIEAVAVAGLHPAHGRRRRAQGRGRAAAAQRRRRQGVASIPPRCRTRSWCARRRGIVGSQCIVVAIDAKRVGVRQVGGLHPRRPQGHRPRRREWARSMAAARRGRDPAHQHGPRRHARRLRPRL